MKLRYLAIILFWLNSFLLSSIASSQEGGAKAHRGIDFRMQFNTGKVNFTNISGIKRDFNGVGSELQTSLYLTEWKYFRSSLFISSRVMSWTGKDTQPGENDDMQTFSVAPGFEMQSGPFFIQTASQNINANSYFISSSSLGKQFKMNGNSLAVGFNYRFGHLGLGFGVTKMDFSVPGETLGINSESRYIEQSYSLNLVYYIGVPPLLFFRQLFAK
jgi:hypothetical protein